MAINKRTYILPKGTEPTAEVISDLLGSVKRTQEVKKYDLLEQYYNAEAITQDNSHKEPLIAVTAYSRYITSLNCGYLLGNPVTYNASEGHDIEKIQEAYDAQKIQNIDIKLENDAKEVVEAAEAEEDRKDEKAFKMGGFGTFGDGDEEDTENDEETPEDAE